MALPFKNEILHSYLIRSINEHESLTSYSSLLGIIDVKGQIWAIPKLVRDCENFTARYSDEMLFSLLINHLPFRLIFPTFQAYLELKNHIFRSKNSVRFRKIIKMKTHLRYCPMCFISQIEEHGVPWFKSDWLFTSQCNIHMNYLSCMDNQLTACCFKLLNPMENLRAAFSGVCPHCSTTEWAFGDSTSQHNYRNYEIFPSGKDYKIVYSSLGFYHLMSHDAIRKRLVNNQKRALMNRGKIDGKP